MSWDIAVQKIPENVEAIDDIPSDFTPEPLGRREEIIKRIIEVVPETNFSDLTWGTVDKGSYSIEFNMGDQDICTSFMIHVRGGSDAVKLIDNLLQSLNLKGIDCQSGDFFKIEESESTLIDWQKYKDSIIEES